MKLNNTPPQDVTTVEITDERLTFPAWKTGGR